MIKTMSLAAVLAAFSVPAWGDVTWWTDNPLNGSCHIADIQDLPTTQAQVGAFSDGTGIGTSISTDSAGNVIDVSLTLDTEDGGTVTTFYYPTKVGCERSPHTRLDFRKAHGEFRSPWDPN
jgi:hypothetical protein